jgi:hypothetical protein
MLWYNLDVILGSDLRTSSQFIPLDVTNSATWKKSRAYLKAHIFTLIYFLSEIYVEREAADQFLRDTFSAMRTGSILIVLDFQDNRLTEWVEDIAANCQLAKKIAADNAEWVIDPLEEKSDLGEWQCERPGKRLRIQTNWTRIPLIPSMIHVAMIAATTVPPIMNRSANALLTPCAIMTARAPVARCARTKNAPSQ